MAEMHIERLALKLSGIDERGARRLAEQVAAGLERLPLAGQLPDRLELVRVRVNPAPEATQDQLADQIVAELIRELRRS
jgi:hypothetical protein